MAESPQRIPFLLAVATVFFLKAEQAVGVEAIDDMQFVYGICIFLDLTGNARLPPMKLSKF